MKLLRKTKTSRHLSIVALLLGLFALLVALALLRVRKLGEHSRQFAALATRQRQELDAALRRLNHNHTP